MVQPLPLIPPSSGYHCQQNRVLLSVVLCLIMVAK
uniref:Uncharacterized protein n=1 Tax=Myoviridae sp. ctjz83 TaxID=2826083 RepID=A0A8D9PDW8_9CAUD|nr:MAG TPA: hypothetical protein [Myoviridae sp. ctjz83]